MPTQTELKKNVFEDVLESLRKAAEANVEMQQEMFRQWSEHWPGFPQMPGNWSDKLQRFQKEWARTAKDLVAKHREVFDKQYDLASESLEEAFRTAQSSDPQQFASRCQDACRKSLDIFREIGELQIKETQDALNKWISLAVKSASSN
jgi:hypothetical protein